ncbi:Hypothetical predicted protein [Podarcis lilfordi]|uniref:Endonuclease/exonuclease/phosphatase domain-containing protein n=1 Tax=Podarcis lilfordi TaxID=74358 RepID=A0AA35PMV1_9SAUR|nr:Hypothetical predicted protein [Podarcis lilfordi]
MDKKINPQGKKRLEWVYSHDLYILHGSPVNVLYGQIRLLHKRRGSVIDYIIVSPSLFHSVNSFEVLERAESNHFPLLVKIYPLLESLSSPPPSQQILPESLWVQKS